MGQYESGYDAVSDLRLVRVTGRFDVEWFVTAAPQDPTIVHLPGCVTIVDLRLARMRGAPSEVADVGGRLAGLAQPDLATRYALVVKDMQMVGFALLLLRAMGQPRVSWFATMEDAAGYLGVTLDDVARAEAALRVVEAPA